MMNEKKPLSGKARKWRIYLVAAILGIILYFCLLPVMKNLFGKEFVDNSFVITPGIFSIAIIAISIKYLQATGGINIKGGKK